MTITRRAFLALAAMGPLMTGCALQPAQDMAAPRAVDFDWYDASRARLVPVRLHWPLRSVQQVPLVVFSHGIGGSRQGYHWFGEYMARQGWASLHVEHVGSDQALWSGNPFDVVHRLQAAAQEIEAIHRVHDVRFALDQLEGASMPNGIVIDRARVVMAGHSYGANTSLLVAGASVLRQGHRVDLRDPRFSAAILMSAPPFYGESDLLSILAPVTVPTLHISTTGDVIRIPGYESGPQDRVAVFDAIREPHKLLVMYEGGSHSIFTDRSGDHGHAHRIKTATKTLALAWVRQVYTGDDASLFDWQTQWRTLLHYFAKSRAPIDQG